MTGLPPELDLGGRAVLVVGASRGLGADLAAFLSRLGARVYGSSREQRGADAIAQRFGTRPVRLDVSNVEEARATVTELLGDDHTIDMLVCNAGVNAPQPALEIDVETWDDLYAVNIRGLFFLTQACARVWVARGDAAAVVHVGSQAGLIALEDRAAYGSSKAAVHQLTRNLAYEWASHGIRVNAVAPTFVATELTRSTLQDPERASRLLAGIPIGRFGTPRDVSTAVAFLLSSGASMITGHTLAVDGGSTIH